MRSSTKSLSSVLHSLRLKNIFFTPKFTKCFPGNWQKKFHQYMHWKIGLRELVNHDTSESEKESLDFLSSGTFQFLESCLLRLRKIFPHIISYYWKNYGWCSLTWRPQTRRKTWLLFVIGEGEKGKRQQTSWYMVQIQALVHMKTAGNF